ncbi:carboxylesterase 1-like [Tripterygium wilfordii]|uniref:Carboxylesterase 1-like n=1 Tax=Tripterygium wilfordii TaxID=458696 RepID=A0A7J7CAB3_TRIWF|nr:probable carboxylesterase 120 [Tripterygium wilfordii]KAF5731111.1 carboxylesterase 1-like [Tripterygium wilfordii]
MSDLAPPLSNPAADPYGYLDLTHHPDGTITRKASSIPTISFAPDLSHSSPVLFKDIPINQSKNNLARVFVPRETLDSTSTNAPLPLILYYHGGGFVITTAATCLSHDFCFNIALQLSAVVISVDYRLAPEHRLPAAYDDAMEALHWIKTADDDWLRKHADLNNCFVMGTSAGANIAYHACLGAVTQVNDLLPLKIKGLVLHHPFFGGVKRTESELRSVNDAVLPPAVSDLMWELSLPIGVDRDHEYCNPTAGGGSKMLDKMGLLGWKVLVTGCDGDPLIDRQIAVAKMMEEKGVQVKSHFSVGDYHGADLVDPSKSTALFIALKSFLMSPMAD